jgi:hypothetical protein
VLVWGRGDTSSGSPSSRLKFGWHSAALRSVEESALGRRSSRADFGSGGIGGEFDPHRPSNYLLKTRTYKEHLLQLA